MVIEVGLLGQKSDLRLHPRIVDRHAQNPSAARRWKYQAHQELEGSGLACSIRAEKAEDFSLFDGEAQRTQGKFRPLTPEASEVGFFQIKNFDCSHNCARRLKFHV